MVQELNYGRINMFWFLIGFARCGQVRFRFSRALRSVRKCVFVFQEPCAVCANAFLFFKSLAQRAQTRFCFSRGLRSVRKRVLISFCLCATCASLFYLGNTLAQRAQACSIFDSHFCFLCITVQSPLVLWITFELVVSFWMISFVVCNLHPGSSIILQ